MFAALVRPFPLLIAALAVLFPACAGSYAQAEGQVLGERFSIDDRSPELKIRPMDAGQTLVFSEEREGNLTTIAITIPSALNLEAGDELDLMHTDIVVRASIGKVVHGDNFVSTQNARFFEIREGTLRFDSLENPIAGDFKLVFVDGEIDGSFLFAGSLLAPSDETN